MKNGLLMAAGKRRVPLNDPYFANVVLLMHMDDVGLTDVKGRAITKVGNTTRSATQSKFGGYSAYFDGAGDTLTFADSAAWDFGTADFTVECWAYLVDVSGNRVILQFGDYASFLTDIVFYVSDGKISVYNLSGVVASTATVSANQWTHLAWCRSGTTLRMFTSGVVAHSYTNGNNIAPTGSPPYFGIGGDIKFSNAYINGYLDEVRVTKGVARYTANFTPPTSPFPDA